MKVPYEQLECLQEQLCVCEQETDPSGAFSMTTVECMYCQFIDDLFTLYAENKVLCEAVQTRQTDASGPHTIGYDSAESGRCGICGSTESVHTCGGAESLSNIPADRGQPD